MPVNASEMRNRRRFLAFLAGSPLLLGQQPSDIITDAAQAINVMDFEPACRKALPPAHFGYMAGGVDDDATLKANRDAFSRLYLRPRRFIDVSKVDTSTQLLGASWETPIALAPIGSQRAFHPDGELATARAAKSCKALQILSSVTTSPIGDVCREAGYKVWYQLYPTSTWEGAERLVRRAEEAGSPVVVFTIDTGAGSHRETLERSRRLDKRVCSSCHGTTPADFFRRKPMYEGMDVTSMTVHTPTMTWDHVRRLRKFTKMKLVIKGIETWEDAKLCREAGVDAIVVSNHGGRAAETGRGTLDCLPEIVEAVGKDVPILIDGGFRRGTDVFKALALGAKGILIGRPYIWGLSAFGQTGVERVYQLLRAELELVMKQCGARSLSEIARTHVGYLDRRA